MDRNLISKQWLSFTEKIRSYESLKAAAWRGKVGSLTGDG